MKRQSRVGLAIFRGRRISPFGSTSFFKSEKSCESGASDTSTCHQRVFLLKKMEKDKREKRGYRLDLRRPHAQLHGMHPL